MYLAELYGVLSFVNKTKQIYKLNKFSQYTNKKKN